MNDVVIVVVVVVYSYQRGRCGDTWRNNAISISIDDELMMVDLHMSASNDISDCHSYLHIPPHGRHRSKRTYLL